MPVPSDVDEDADFARRVAELRAGGAELVAGSVTDLAGVTRAKYVPLRRLAAFQSAGMGVSPSWSVFCVDSGIAFTPLATSATSGRMLYAFARDGFGPKALAHIHADTGGPRRATWLVVVIALVVNLICGAAGWPDMGTGNDAIDTYFLFAVAGSVCLMVCYLLVEIAAAWFVGSPKFLGVHGGQGKVLGLVLPLLGALVIVVVLWFNVKDAETWSAAALLGLYWCLVGLVIAIAASGIAKRVGESLSAELNLKTPLRTDQAGAR